MVALAQRRCYLCLLRWCKTREEINGAKLDKGDEFCYNGSMTTPEQKEQKARLLKAKIAVALQDETGKVPSKEKIEEVFLLTRVMYKAVLGCISRERNRRSRDSWQSSKSIDLCLLATPASPPLTRRLTSSRTHSPKRAAPGSLPTPPHTKRPNF